MNRNLRKEREGIVFSDSMHKTISVVLERKVKHPIYGKYMSRSTKILAHDEKNECKVGDKVRVMETRPLSKRKRWIFVDNLNIYLDGSEVPIMDGSSKVFVDLIEKAK